MTPSTKHISAIERLRSLPAIFRGGDLTVRFQWPSRRASHYLYLWKRRGLIEPLGGHSDVFANLLLDPRPDWEAALQMAMPSAIVIGIEALRRAGWTTQVPARPQIAIDTGGPIFSTPRFTITPRPPKWFHKVRAKGLSSDHTAGLPVLDPAWALADLLREDDWGDFGLWPDDIEWDEISPADEASWHAATAALLRRPAASLSQMRETTRHHARH